MPDLRWPCKDLKTSPLKVHSVSTLSKMLFSRETVTPDNYGPVVSVVTWILLVSMFLSVCAKIAIKVVACHRFDADDAMLSAAMVILPCVSVQDCANRLYVLDC